MTPSAAATTPILEPTQDERNSLKRLLHIGASPQDKLRSAQSSFQKALAEAKCYHQKLQEHDEVKKAGEKLHDGFEAQEKEISKNQPVKAADFDKAKEKVRQCIKDAEKAAKTADPKVAKSVKLDAKGEEPFQAKYLERRARCERRLERVQRRLVQLKKEAKATKGEGKKGLSLAPLLLEVQENRETLTKAAAQAGNGLYKTAFKTLKPLEKNLAKLAAQTKKDSSKEGEQLKGKADWDRRKGKVELLIANLETRPGTKDAVQKINERLKTLDAAAANGQYADAYKDLGDLKKQVLEADDKAAEAEDDMPMEIQNASRFVEDRIKQLQDLAPDAVATAENELKDILDNFLDSKNKPAVSDVTAALVALKDKLEKSATEAKKTKKAYEEKRKQAEDKLNELAKFLSHQELEENRLLYDEAEEKAADHDYQEAGELLKKLQESMAAYSARQKEYEKWQEQEGYLKRLEERLAALIGDQTIWEKWPSVLQGYTDARKVLDEVKKLEANRDYANALKKFGALGPKVKAAEDQAEKWKKFSETHKELANNLKQDFEKKHKAVGESMNKLVEELRKSQPGFLIADLGKRHEKYAQIGTDWNKELRNAETADELRKAHSTATSALSDLADEFKKFAESPDALEALKKEKAQEKPYILAESSYRKAEQAAASKLKSLREKGSPEYAKLEAEFNKVVDGVDKDLAKAEKSPQRLEEKTKAYNAALRPLEQLEHDIGQEIKRKIKEANKAKEEAVVEMKAVKDKLDKAVGGKVPMELVTALQKRRKDLNQLLKSGNVDALKVCKERLQEIEADMEDAAKAPDAYQSIRNNYDKLRFESLMEISKLKVMPKRQKELDRTLDHLQSEFMKQPVKEAKRASEEFSKEVDKVRTEALKIHKARKEFKRWLPEAQDLLKQLDEEAKGGNYEKYDGKLRTQVKRAQSLGKAESLASVEAAIAQLKEMVKDGRDLVAKCAEAKKAGGESPVLAEERERADEKKALELQKKIFEGEYENFKSGPFAEVAEAVKQALLNGEKADENQLQFIEDSGKAAKKAGEKAKKLDDLIIARRQLAKAAAATAVLAKEPAGAEITSKKALNQLNVKWKEALKKFKGSVRELMKELDAKSDYSNSNDNKVDVIEVGIQVKRVTKLSEKAMKLFRGTAFENVLKVLDAEPKAAIQEQRKAREEGLRIVRSYRKTALGNPIVKYLMDAPGFKMHVDRRPLMTVLKDLEANLLRCVQK